MPSHCQKTSSHYYIDSYNLSYSSPIFIPIDYDFDDMAVMTAPKPSFGGQRTHRAAQSKAFDFELPFLDTTTNILTPYVPVKEAPTMGVIEESGCVHLSY